MFHILPEHTYGFRIGGGNIKTLNESLKSQKLLKAISSCLI